MSNSSLPVFIFTQYVLPTVSLLVIYTWKVFFFFNLEVFNFKRRKRQTRKDREKQRQRYLNLFEHTFLKLKKWNIRHNDFIWILCHMDHTKINIWYLIFQVCCIDNLENKANFNSKTFLFFFLTLWIIFLTPFFLHSAQRIAPAEQP